MCFTGRYKIRSEENINLVDEKKLIEKFTCLLDIVSVLQNILLNMRKVIFILIVLCITCAWTQIDDNKSIISYMKEICKNMKSKTNITITKEVTKIYSLFDKFVYI